MNINLKPDIIIISLGAMGGYFFGGLDVMLQVFCILLVVDTLSGMIKGFLNGTYQSKLFRIGLLKKCGYMLSIILAVQLDKILGNTGTLRGAMILLFIANEGTSIIENLGEMGVPMPDQVINAIAVLKNKSDNNNLK